ncbi:hypothetical protein PtA15_4A296 [Puccinia triticina]|uniref:Uncharacterized protein n=1 Tax=Puccinia triticina TaxID=208348 RepID=A0ABY7CM34_9BASI|nr:uncharacterized protein PtA15_4A296 [Puccinia triticina]WAQ83847.1 hypothetical protein PtA15_4A296 [Puccinia triticina]WAR54691.1 hypothetical protein PtB15_4B308 [Puccinia triticina]
MTSTVCATTAMTADLLLNGQLKLAKSSTTLLPRSCQKDFKILGSQSISDNQESRSTADSRWPTKHSLD